MKNLLIILSFIPSLVFSQPVYNTQKINEHFLTILNQERSSLNLNPVQIDTTMAIVEDVWAQKVVSTYVTENDKLEECAIKKVPYVWNINLHGEGEEYFSNRCLKLLGSRHGMSENIAGVFFLKDSVINEYEIALALFTKWKNSKGHYTLMTDPNIDFIYLGVATQKRKEGSRWEEVWFGGALSMKKQKEFQKGFH